MALLRASKKPPNCQRVARWVWSVGSMARLRGCRFHMLVTYRPWSTVPLRRLRKPQQSKYLGSLWDQTKKTSRSTVLKRPPLFLKKSVISQRPNTWAAICGRCTLVIATWPPPKKNTHTPMARSFKTVWMQPTKESDIFFGWRGVFRWPFPYIINILGWKMMTGTVKKLKHPILTNPMKSHETSLVWPEYPTFLSSNKLEKILWR